ncbi:MAG TPA: hypothetical protein VM406_00855 [Noviherbaspirillum sp.]|nr:hypothetical protein [Noviherbaspirillum sp.]
MRRTPIPEDVRSFLRSDIPTVPHLEALLLMRSTPDAQWNAVQLARRLYLSEVTASGLLRDLRSRGLVTPAEHGEACRYAPADSRTCALIDRLAQLYSTNLVGISNLIHSVAQTDRTARPPGSDRRGN